jgi:transglutaminase-like putative cysteine protease
VHESLGRHHLRRHNEGKALDAFTKALALKPQNPQLRELVRSVRPDDNYAAPYLYDGYAIARDARQDPKTIEEDVEMLADLSVTRVFANGLASRTRQIVIRALTPRGVEATRSQSVQYSPDRQVVKVERARILRKDGTVLESKSEGERNLSEPWYGLYYDVRARFVHFPQLEPGDAIELVTRTDDAGSANFFADYFGDFAYLQSTWRKRVADYVLLGPPGRTFYSQATPLENLKHTEGKLPDGGQWMRWTATNVPRLVPEPAMPGSSELLAHVHVSTYKDWTSVGKFYWGLVKDQLRVTDEIRTAANEVVKAIPPDDELGRIRALYNFVVSRTRYVGLEFGIHSFKPYSVDTILNRKFGDCKDKASLLHALLEAVGIDSRLTLLRMKRLGGIEANIASLAVFNHAILYIPKHDLFLDGTAEFHGSNELPAEDRGAEVLVVEPDGRGDSKFFRTPESRPEDNADEAEVMVHLSRDGSATLAIDGKARGTWTAELRRSYESPDSRRRLAEERLARSAFPGVKVTSVEVSDPHEIEKPFETRFVAQLSTFATLDVAGKLRFRPFGQQTSYVESYASLSSRALPQRFSSPYSNKLRYAIELPAGFTATLPEGANESSPQGSYDLRYKLDGGRVVAELSVTLRGGLLQPAEYPAFRAFLSRLDSALQRQVEAAPRTTTAEADQAKGAPASLEGRR